MRLFLPNFDFEYHLARAAPRSLPAHVRRLNAELAFAFVAIADVGDVIWTTEVADPDYSRHLAEIGLPEVRTVSEVSQVPGEAELCPWGWSEGVRNWGTANGWQFYSPPSTVVATANSRAFSSALEREWGVGLPLSRTLTTIDDFREALGGLNGDAGWVVKANFGMSARERVIGRGSQPSEQAVRWIRKRLAESEAVYFEPWVDRIDEFGFQFTIPASGAPVLEGITTLLTDSQGTYRGSRWHTAERGQLACPTACELAPEQRETVVEIVTRAARRVQELGYFGPLGIDAMRYRTADAKTRWRPLQDINARLTMGRLALGLRRFLEADAHASWLLVRSPNAPAEIVKRFQDIEAALPKDARAHRISPITVGGRLASMGAILITAQSAAGNMAAERIVIARLDEPR